MRNFLLRVIINAICIYIITAGYLPGIRIVGENLPLLLIAIGLIFGLVNALIKPLVNLLTCALTLLTLGLFRLIINGAMLLLTASLSRLVERSIGGRLEVDDLLWGVIGALIISVIAMILERLLGVDGGSRDEGDERW